MTMGDAVQEQQSLDELVKKVVGGDNLAFDELVKRTHKLVRKVAAPLLPASAIDDAVQETYLVVFQKCHHLKSSGAFLSWLSRIALNVCYQWRRRHKETVELNPEHLEKAQSSSSLGIRSALEALQEKDRNILILREFIGLSYLEIADALNLAEGTVRSRLFYARKRLKELLQLAPES